jgi:hypothetical protein
LDRRAADHQHRARRSGDRVEPARNGHADGKTVIKLSLADPVSSQILSAAHTDPGRRPRALAPVLAGHPWFRGRGALQHVRQAPQAPASPAKGFTFEYMTDPDGAILEFIQPPK